MAQQIFEDDPNPNIWGNWTCPICGEELQDPNSVINTMCHQGHSVTLSYAEVQGDTRDSYYREDISLLILNSLTTQG